jgi:hypothetical protein
VTPRILIIHTPSQLEDASSLVDLLEAALALSEGEIQCSSLPGYTLTTRPGAGVQAAEFAALLDQIGAAVALVNEPALCDAQFWFDAAAVWSRGKRLAVVVDDEARAAQLPSQLPATLAIVRSDRSALIGLLEDLAFDLGVDPRIGQGAQRALDQFGSAPEPPPSAQLPTYRPGRLAAAAPASTPSAPASVAIAPTLRGGAASEASSYEAIDTVPPPPRLPGEAIAASDEDADGEAPFQLDDDDVEPVELEPSSSRSGVEQRLTCEIAFDAGRAIAECSFHRDAGGDFAAELDGPFGRFVDAAGGSWQQLKRLGDIELWLGATDNLLESLPATRRDACEWYEIGFQFSTLRSIVEQGLPEQGEQRAVYQELWSKSMAQLRTAAASAGVAPREIRKLQSQLENLIGPGEKRDYKNLGRAFDELRQCCAAADRGELQLAGRAVG